MIKFTWDIDPAIVRFGEVPVFVVAGLLAPLFALFAWQSRDSKGKRDQSGTALWGALAVGALGLAGYAITLTTPWTVSPELRYYSAIFVVVFLGGYALLDWQIRRGGGDRNEAGDFIVYGILGTLFGARVGHMLFYQLDDAIRDPLSILRIWEGGLASHGATVGLIVAMYLFTAQRGVPFVEGADRFAFSAALGATLVRVGNFFNSEIVGRVVPGQAWGVKFPRCEEDAHLVTRLADGTLTPESLAAIPYRYPTQFLEIGLGVIVFVALFIADQVFGKERRPRGLLISLFFLVYFSGRFTVEFIKEYQHQSNTDLLTTGQYLSIPGILVGVLGLIATLQSRSPVGWQPARRTPLEAEDTEEDRPRRRRRRKAASDAAAGPEAGTAPEGDEAPKRRGRRKKASGGEAPQAPAAEPSSDGGAKDGASDTAGAAADDSAAGASSEQSAGADRPAADEPKAD